MKIIAFGHRKRTGKDTAANFLVSHLRMTYPGINVQKRGFADKLKAVAHELYAHHGLKPGSYYEEPENAHLRYVKLPGIGMTPVEIWIALGNGVRDRVHEATWYEYLLNSSRVDVLVVKDMRFPREAEGILALGGHVYRIDRDVAPVDADGADDQLVNFDKWTGKISNNGTLQDFHREVVQIADRLLRDGDMRPLRPRA